MRALLSLKMAYRHVRAGFGRMALSVVAVALGVALVVAVRVMNVTVLASFLETVDAVAGRATFSVTAGEGLTFTEDVVEKVAAVAGVKLAVPLVSSVAFPDDGSGEQLTVFGVDLTHDAAVRLYHASDGTDDIVDDPLVFLSQPDSIILGREFARRRGLETGSPLSLVTPTGVKQFTIRGLLEPKGIARTLGGRLVVMDLYAAERAFTADERINQVDVVVGKGADVEVTKGAVAAVLPLGLRVEEPALRKHVIRQTVAGFQGMLTAFALLAAVAGFVICYNRLGAIYEARTFEVGLLRAVGLRRGVVFWELLKESLLLGAAGTLVGVPLGLLLGYYGLPIVATATALNYRLPVPAAAPMVPWGAVAIGVVVGLGAATLGAVLPTLRLARSEPVAALSLRGRTLPRVSPRVRWVVGTGLLVLVGGLLAFQAVTPVPALGNVASGLLALCAWIIATPLVAHGAALLGRPWRGLFGATGHFAIRRLSQQPRRSAPVVAALGIGLGAVLMFGMLGWSFERTLVTRLSRRFQADLVVSSAFISGGYREASLTEGLVDALAAVPGVALAAGNQSKDVGYRGEQVVIDAYDTAALTDTRVSRWPLDAGALPDALERVALGQAVLVSSTFAYRYGTQVGDIVQLHSPYGPLPFRVAGITSGQVENAVVMARDRYRSSWNDPTVFRVYVALADGAERDAVTAAILERLGPTYRLLVRSSAELIDYFASQVREGFRFLDPMELVAILLVLVGIGDTLASAVVERTRELGVMRAVGLHRSRLFTMILLEGAAVGVLGLLLAAAVGLVLGVFWVEVQFPALLGWTLDFYFPWRFAWKAVLLTLLLCVVGSFLPSVRAARLSVPAALRAE